MDFIINSKQKKVELFYNSAEEQAAVLNFISQWLTYREDSTPNILVKQPDISWASITGCADTYLANTTATNAVSLAAECNGSKQYSDIIDSRISTIEEKVEKQPSYITVSVPRPEKKK